ncbi:MAG: hypothetical protein K6C35_04355 [Eubacterium sp.]|nr:hypothetical protein [Eubacterium sp.]
MAAETLRISDKAFDIKMLHRIAKRIEEFPTFNSLTAADMVDVLSNPSKIGPMQERFFREAHAVPEINVGDYLDSMKTLHENMKLKDGRSPEYRNLYDCVKFISELDPNSHNFENTLMRANKALLQAVRLYTKGKEKRRTFEGGRDRFDNAMDALAIMSANVPGLKKTIISTVNKINKIRNVNEDHRDFVKLENHGAAAAANRKAVREAAANNNQPNRQSNASRSSSL